ncbi:hypothetical protein BC828DRAFT_380154, partial [Blastocladiella britannica]
PGAALLSVDMASKDLTSGDNILVVDCGTGTVDFAAFGKQLLAGADKTSSFNELTRGRTIAMGSMSVDMEFERHMESVFGRVGWDAIALDAAGRTKIFKEWEDIKHGYDGEDVGLSELPLSRSAFKLLKGAGITDFKLRLLAYNRTQPGTTDRNDDELEDVVMLAGATLRRLFDKVVSDIVQVTAEMMADCAANGTNITKVVCVGGFSANKYFLRSIRDMVGTKYPAARVLAPSNSASAVLYGAVIYGVAHGVIKSCVPSTAADTAMASHSAATLTSTGSDKTTAFSATTAPPSADSALVTSSDFVASMHTSVGDSAIATSSLFALAITDTPPVAKAIAALALDDSGIATSSGLAGVPGTAPVALDTVAHEQPAAESPLTTTAAAAAAEPAAIASEVRFHSYFCSSQGRHSNPHYISTHMQTTDAATPNAKVDTPLEVGSLVLVDGQHHVPHVPVQPQAIWRCLEAIATLLKGGISEIVGSVICLAVSLRPLGWVLAHPLGVRNNALNRFADRTAPASCTPLQLVLNGLHVGAAMVTALAGRVLLLVGLVKRVIENNGITPEGILALATALRLSLVDHLQQQSADVATVGRNDSADLIDHSDHGGDHGPPGRAYSISFGTGWVHDHDEADPTICQLGLVFDPTIDGHEIYALAPH